MHIVFDNGDSKQISFSGTVLELFRKLNLNLEEYLVSLSDEILTSDSVIKDSDSLLLINVVSGG